ncbi:hypothetical protein [Haloplanus rubicundus]|uniref:hypothetical protein n=1 Tax=Haloplanus rubicundus TaxID=1547898 RepID=UPI0013003C66|nr:hypothetical protein [Haloplanus rubicundus]
MSDNDIDTTLVLIIALGVGLLISPILGFILLPGGTIYFYGLIAIIGAVGPPLVSLVLAYLYLELRKISEDQREIHRDQVKIQKQQRRILELEQLPQLVVNFWEVENDSLEFEITNVGDGAAYNIGYVLEVEPFELGNPPIQTDLNPHFDLVQVIPFVRSDEGISKHHNTLENNMTGTFSETACLVFEEDDDTYCPFSEGCLSLNYPDQDCYVNVRMWLCYSDAVHDNRQSQPVMDVILTRDQIEGKSFAEVVTADPVGDTRYDDGNRMVLPENVEESRLERFRRHGLTTTQLGE